MLVSSQCSLMAYMYVCGVFALIQSILTWLYNRQHHMISTSSQAKDNHCCCTG